VSFVYAILTLSGSCEFHASSASRTFCVAVSFVNGGTGGLTSFWTTLILVASVWFAVAVVIIAAAALEVFFDKVYLLTFLGALPVDQRIVRLNMTM